MAIFASTTTSGYSDPMKALSIKALEQRQKDMLALQGKQEGITPENTQTPVQGIAHVINQLGDSMQQGRAAATLAEQRGHLSQLIAGIDPKTGASQGTIAQIYALDPEEGARLMAQNASMQEHAAARAAAEASQQRTFTHEDAAAVKSDARTRELAEQTDTRARDLAREADTRARELAQISDERAKALAQQNDTRARELKQLEIDAAAKLAQAKANADAEANARDPKTITAQKGLEKEATQERALVEELGVAKKDLDAGIFTGRGSGAAVVASQLPIVGEYIGDKEKANRTTQFDATMDKVAITNMSTILKGSSTDKEMAAFKTMWNNPNATIDQKRDAFGRVLQAAKEDQVIGEAALERMGTKRLVPGGPAAAVAGKEGGTADPAAAAQAAIDSGAPFDAVAERFKSKGGDPSVLKRKAP
jgi:hypothetical protein